jgi:hypothetical protein
MAWGQVGNIRGPIGATGSQGPVGSPGSPGVGFTWRGVWSSSSAYAINDCVSRNNQSYVCIIANTGNDPSTDTTHWSLIAQSIIAYSTSTVTVPVVGQSFSVPCDQVNWMSIGLPIAMSDLSNNLLGSFLITALDTVNKIVTLQRIA